MDRRILTSVAALAAFAMSAQAEPQPRGPVLPVVRPAAKEFPLRATNELKGDVDAKTVVEAAWTGPRLAADDVGAPRQWMRLPQSAWDRLRDWQDALFADARAEKPGRR